MLRSYFRLVLKDGSSFTVGDDWPEPDTDVRRAVGWLRQIGHVEAASALARAAQIGDSRINGKIWMIVHQPEIVENYTADESSFTKQIQPERYLLLMRNADSADGEPHGNKNPAACGQCKGVGCSACPEETQILEVLVSDVTRAHRVHGWHDATDIVKDLFNDMNEDLLPPDPDDDDDEDDDDEKETEPDRPNGKDVSPPAAT